MVDLSTSFFVVRLPESMVMFPNKNGDFPQLWSFQFQAISPTHQDRGRCILGQGIGGDEKDSKRFPRVSQMNVRELTLW